LNHSFRCIVDHLKDKTRILVTHQVQFLKNATKILVLKEGKRIAFGTYDELIKSGINFMSFVTEAQKTDKKTAKITENVDPNIALRHLNRANANTHSIASSIGADIPDIKEEPLPEDEPKLKEEIKMIGSIDSSVYWEYVKAGAGTFLMIITVTTLVLSQALYQGSDLWLTEWFVQY